MSSVITLPTVEPVTLAEAKRQCNVYHDNDDAILERLIVAARQHIESICELSLVRQQRRIYLNAFADEVRLPFGPVQSITQVQYIDADGATQTLSTSVYKLLENDNCMVIHYGQTWPSTRYEKNAVWIDYYAGFYDNSESPVNVIKIVPEPIKAAILLLVSDMYEYRETQLDINTYTNRTFDSLLSPWREYLA